MAGQMTAPKAVCILIPDTYEYVTLRGNGDFTDMIKLIILRWGDDFGLGGSNVNHKASHKREAGRSKTEAENVIKEAEVGMMCSEDGGKGHKPRNSGGCWKLEKTRKQIFP